MKTEFKTILRITIRNPFIRSARYLHSYKSTHNGDIESYSFTVHREDACQLDKRDAWIIKAALEKYGIYTDAEYVKAKESVAEQRGEKEST